MHTTRPPGRRWPRRARRLLAGLGIVGTAAAAWVWFAPPPVVLRAPRAVTSTLIVTDRNGKPLDGASTRLLALRAAPGRDGVAASVGSGEQAGVPSLARRAWRLAAATVAAEDQRFASHPGIDAVAIGRAALHDVRARRVVEGGSTLTQQLVKLRLDRAGRSGGWRSKLDEAIAAVRVDRRWTKDEILSAFLSEAPYGGRVVGAEDAAQVYFGVAVSQLSWAQSAYLAALPQRPTRYNPRRDADAPRTRQLWILDRLRADGVITQREWTTARSEQLDIATELPEDTAPHVVAMVRSGRSGDLLGERSAADGIVRTTLDAELQEAVSGIAAHQRDALREHHAANVAVVVLDNTTGAIRAWEGSGGWEDPNGGQLNGPLVARQTGSTIKAFVYGLAFDRGAAPGDLVDDSPFTRPGLATSFDPKNYDHRFRGPITMRVALGSSVNVPAVRLLDEVGPQALIELLGRNGVNVPGGVAGNGLSLALGTAEIDLLDLTRGYAAFARGGRTVRATLAEPAQRQPKGTALVSSAAAYLVTDVLSDNDARTPAFGARSVLRFPFPVAAKTGTSQNFHDNWVVGYTSQFTVGVWVGNFDRTPLAGATGITGAGPVFRDVMLAAHRILTPGWGLDRQESIHAQLPDELEEFEACADDTCTSTYGELRWRGALGDDETAGTRGVASGADAATIDLASTSTLAPAEGGDGTAEEDARSQGGAPLALTLNTPSAGTVYVIDPLVPIASQRLALRAVGGVAPYRFTVDGKPAEHSWELVPGEHRACVGDAAGTMRCADFTVR